MDSLVVTLGLIVSVVAIAMASSIVWHTEMRLDLAFKFFLTSAVLMAIAFTIDLGYLDGLIQEQTSRRLFSNGSALFMLLGFIEMRQLLGNRSKKSSSKKRR